MIDAHQHFWKIGFNGHAWPGPDLPAIHRDIIATELKTLARPLGVTGSIAVQSQPHDEDTEFLLRLAAADNFVLGVVGWMDLERDGVDRLAQLSSIGPLCGIRPMLQGLGDDDWIAEAQIDRAIQAMIEHGHVFDALIFTRHLAALTRFADRWPELRIVIDHAAKPPIGHDLSAWREAVYRLAERPNVHCKLSGLATEMSDQAPLDDADPVVAFLFEIFGPSRLIWGSDWPVLTLACDYGAWLRYCLRAIPEEARGAVFHDNAARLYRCQRIDSDGQSSTSR